MSIYFYISQVAFGLSNNILRKNSLAEFEYYCTYEMNNIYVGT